MRSIAILAFAALMAVAGIEARAQDGFPSQVVKIVVPAAAGSTTDTLARLVADSSAANGASLPWSRTSPAAA